MHIQPGLVPRYYQLKEILEKRIQTGEFHPDDQFPTDENLCDEYGLSRGTVRRAIDMLVEEGRLRREQGRGTFVTAPLLTPFSSACQALTKRCASVDEPLAQNSCK